MTSTAQDVIQDWMTGTPGAISTVAELRELYDEPLDVPAYRHFEALTPAALDLIRSARLIFLASFGSEGKCEISPRGGPAGFVEVLDSNTFAIPDAKGNRHLLTLANIVENGRVGVFFVTPGDNFTLRVIGNATVSVSAEARDLFHYLNKPPLSVIMVKVEECFVHCPKAFARSELWKYGDTRTAPAPHVTSSGRKSLVTAT